MTSATTRPATGGRHAEGHGYGLVLFASVLLVILGCFNMIYGIAAQSLEVIASPKNSLTPGPVWWPVTRSVPSSS